MVLDVIEAILTNIASHHSTMLAIGSLLAVLPGLLSLAGYPEEDKNPQKMEFENTEGEIVEVEVDNSHPRMHWFVRVLGFIFGGLSGYSGYLTVMTASQDPLTAGLLFSNAIMLMSRTAAKYKWAFPASVGVGGLGWIQILRLLNATPDLLVSAVGVTFLSILVFVPTLYAERGVKQVGDIMNRSAPAVIVGSIGGFQAVALAIGGSLSAIPPYVVEWFIKFIGTFGGG